MTAPLRNATLSAWFIPPSLAALAVRTLPFVATCMPKNPASTEKAAPMTNSVAVIGSMNSARTIVSTTTTMTIVRYSLFRNAMDPSWMNPAISCILSFPGS